MNSALEIARQANVWRSQLAAGSDALMKTARLVSEQMADFAALQTAETLRRSMVDLQSLFAGRRPLIDVAAMRTNLTPWFETAARVAALDWAEAFSGWDSGHRELDAQLRSYGWWVLGRWTSSFVEHLLDVAQTEGRRGVNRAICEYYRENGQRRMRQMVDSWYGDPVYRLRRPIIRDALRDHAHGRYRVSVPTLLPLVEGITVDVFQPGTKSTGVAMILAQATAHGDTWGRVFTDSLLALVTGLWSWQDFSTASPFSRRLNRHLIIHGRTVRYGSETNSLKVFLALEQLSSEVRRRRALERSGEAAAS